MENSVIAVDREGDILIFASVNEAESYLEPIDVGNNEYQVFSVDGMRFAINVEKSKVFFGPEKTKLILSLKNCSEDLKHFINIYLLKINQPAVEVGKPIRHFIERLCIYSGDRNN